MAQAVFRAYVTAGPARIEWLRAKTGLELAFERGALVEVWEWFLAWARAGGWAEPADGYPPWMPPRTPDAPEPLRSGRPARSLTHPSPDLSPAVAWVADAMSYHLAEVLRRTEPAFRYELYRDNPPNIQHDSPTLGIGRHDFIPLSLPLTPGRRSYALRPSDDWQARARRPDHLALRHEEIVGWARETLAKPPPGPPRPFRGRRPAELFEVYLAGEEGDVPGEVRVAFDDELAHTASDALDELVERLADAGIDGVRTVERADRELIALRPHDGAAIDRRAVARGIERHVKRIAAAASAPGPDGSGLDRTS
jgi:hypothetical protein